MPYPSHFRKCNLKRRSEVGQPVTGESDVFQCPGGMVEGNYQGLHLHNKWHRLLYSDEHIQEEQETQVRLWDVCLQS